MRPPAGRRYSIHPALDKEYPSAPGVLRATSATADPGLGPSSRESLAVLVPAPLGIKHATCAKTTSNMDGKLGEARKPSCHELRLVYGMPTSGANPDVEFGCQNPFLQPDIAKSSCHVFPSQTQTPCECQLVSPPRLAWLGLSLLVVEDITVTSVQDGHGGAAEELAASGAKLNL